MSVDQNRERWIGWRARSREREREISGGLGSTGGKEEEGCGKPGTTRTSRRGRKVLMPCATNLRASILSFPKGGLKPSTTARPAPSVDTSFLETSNQFLSLKFALFLAGKMSKDWNEQDVSFASIGANSFEPYAQTSTSTLLHVHRLSQTVLEQTRSNYTIFNQSTCRTYLHRHTTNMNQW